MGKLFYDIFEKALNEHEISKLPGHEGLPFRYLKQMHKVIKNCDRIYNLSVDLDENVDCDEIYEILDGFRNYTDRQSLKDYYEKNSDKIKPLIGQINNFKIILKNHSIDFEDYLSRMFLLSESDLFSGRYGMTDRVWIEENFMILLYWYFWHHIRNFTKPKVFPRPNSDQSYKDDYITDLFTKILCARDALLTLNNDLIMESSDKIAYRSEKKNDDQILYLKLHGSVNWIPRWSLGDKLDFYANNKFDGALAQIINRPVSDFSDILRNEVTGNHIKLINEYFNMDRNAKPAIAIMPPVLFKGTISNDSVNLIFKNIWTDAQKCLENAEKIIFAGLALRDTDYMLQVMLRDSIRNHWCPN